MDNVTRYVELNKHIASLESFFDVLRVLSNHGLLGEIKSSSMGYIFGEMSENLEMIKKLREETCEKLKETREVSHYVSPF